jgi:glycosyltransferase involved in cell wall biosynthesis
VSPRLSFVVPVRNDAVRLETCLRSIRAAAGKSGRIEVVVVDNGSIDGSCDVARALGARVLVIESGRVSELRNHGASHAEGELLAFVDADNEIVPGWIDAVVQNLGELMVGATGSQYTAPLAGTWVQRAFGVLRGRTLVRGDVEWIGSGNIAVRRDVFEAVGGFDTSLDTCEDVDLCHRIHAAGFRVLGDPRVESVHHGDPRTLGDLFKNELWRGRDNLRVSFRRPIVWASVPSAVLPVVEAFLLFAGVVGLLGWLAAWTPGAVIAAVALFFVISAAFLRVLRSTVRERTASAAHVPQALVVTCVYDLARALALLLRAPHRSTRTRAAATTTS